MWRTRSFLRLISTVLATFPMEERARAPLPVMARRGCREGIGHVAACVVVACVSLVRAGAAWPQETGALADQVKAAYVYKFAGYIETRCDVVPAKLRNEAGIVGAAMAAAAATT